MLCVVDKEFQGRKIRVQVASRKVPAGTPLHAVGMGIFIYSALLSGITFLKDVVLQSPAIVYFASML